MSIDHWDKLPNGNIETFPFLGLETAPTATFGLVRLRFATTEAQFESGQHEALQLTMTPVQLRQASAALLRMAEHIEGMVPAGPTQ